MNILALLISVLFISSCKPSQVEPDSETKVVIEAQESESSDSLASTAMNTFKGAIGRVLSKERSMANKSSCTIFNTTEGVLTAGHCIFWGQPEMLRTSDLQVDWKHVDYASLENFTLANSNISYKLNNSQDYAWLSNQPTPSATQKFELAKVDSKIPDQMIVLGFPLNTTKAECNSLFSSFRHKAFECATREMVQTTCKDIKLTEGGFTAVCDKPIAPGFSGSPAFNISKDPEGRETGAQVWGILNSTSGERTNFTGVQALSKN